MSGFDPDQNKAEATAKRATIDEAPARAELEGGERLLWTGAPNAQRAFFAGFAVYLFAIPWTAFSLFWESMALMPLFHMHEKPDNVPLIFAIVFPLFGLPFIAIGFFMLATPFIAARQARCTTYAITDRRALIIRAGLKREVESFSFASISESEISRKERKDHSGSLFFATKRTIKADSSDNVKSIGFEHIENVRMAEERLRRALQTYAPRTGHAVQEGSAPP